MTLRDIFEDLLLDLRPLSFGPPVTHVYNPLEYARRPHEQYLRRFASRSREVVLLGMNPGPWGMAQTGIPFGEIRAVREWLNIEAPVGAPGEMHPRRPVQGFDCPRSEVSGSRLWGWAQRTFGTPERFFARFFVANYCPLLFIEESGRNRTPDNLRAGEKAPLFAACDRALQRLVQWLGPSHVVGVGRFAEARARAALSGSEVMVGRITHPSPANPRANRGWESLVEEEFRAMGIALS